MFPLQKLIRTPIHLLVNTLFLHNIFRSNKRQLLSKHLCSANFISMSSVCLYCMLLWKGLSEHLIEESGNVFCSIGDINCVVRKSSPSTEANTVKSWIGGSWYCLSEGYTVLSGRKSWKFLISTCISTCVVTITLGFY